MEPQPRNQYAPAVMVGPVAYRYTKTTYAVVWYRTPRKGRNGQWMVVFENVGDPQTAVAEYEKIVLGPGADKMLTLGATIVAAQVSSVVPVLARSAARVKVKPKAKPKTKSSYERTRS